MPTTKLLQKSAGTKLWKTIWCPQKSIIMRKTYLYYRYARFQKVQLFNFCYDFRFAKLTWYITISPADRLSYLPCLKILTFFITFFISVHFLKNHVPNDKQERRKVWKSGGASIDMVDIICSSWLKSGETLMEDRSDSDVQIDRRSWV